MSAGYIVSGACVDSSAALDLYYSAVPAAIAAGSPEYITLPNKGVSGWNLDTYSGGVLVSSFAAPSPALPACDTSASFNDGLSLGWGVVAAMAVAWAIHVLRRGF